MFHILLDTEVFHRENLHFDSRRFARLVDLVKDNEAAVYVVDVTVGEVRSAITKRVHEAIEFLKPKDTRRVLGILVQSDHANLPGLLTKLDDGAIVEELRTKFDRLLEQLKVEVLTTDIVSVAELRKRYFAPKPPFDHKDEKKSEFPDALLILSAEAHAIERNLTLHVVSNDSGIEAAAKLTESLEHVESLQVMVDLALKSVAATAGLAELAEEVVVALANEINDLFRDRVEEGGFFVLDDQGEVIDVTVDHVDVGDPVVADVDDDLLTLELVADIEFTADVMVADPSQMAYDSETGGVYVFGHLGATVHESESVEGELIIRVKRSNLAKSEILSLSLLGADFGVRFPWGDEQFPWGDE